MFYFIDLPLVSLFSFLLSQFSFYKLENPAYKLLVAFISGVRDVRCLLEEHNVRDISHASVLALAGKGHDWRFPRPGRGCLSLQLLQGGDLRSLRKRSDHIGSKPRRLLRKKGIKILIFHFSFSFFFLFKEN